MCELKPFVFFNYYSPYFLLLELFVRLNPPFFFVQFDALVAALPLAEGGEEAQLKRIAELQVLCYVLVAPSQVLPCAYSFLAFSCISCQAENDAVGQELQRQLEAAGNFLNLRAFWMSCACYYESRKDEKEKHPILLVKMRLHKLVVLLRCKR